MNSLEKTKENNLLKFGNDPAFTSWVIQQAVSHSSPAINNTYPIASFCWSCRPPNAFHSHKAVMHALDNFAR